MAYISTYLMVYILVQTEWDITRFADKVKNTKVDENKESPADLTLPLHFPQAEFGKLTDPATILDLHGKVMVWALPGVLHPNRIVRNLTHVRLTWFYNIIIRRTTMKQYVTLTKL
jgi:hypothetical protein